MCVSKYYLQLLSLQNPICFSCVNKVATASIKHAGYEKNLEATSMRYDFNISVLLLLPHFTETCAGPVLD